MNARECALHALTLCTPVYWSFRSFLHTLTLCTLSHSAHLGRIGQGGRAVDAQGKSITSITALDTKVSALNYSFGYQDTTVSALDTKVDAGGRGGRARPIH